MTAKRRRSTPTKAKAAPASASPALDYAAWKKAAREILSERHGVSAPVIREKDWRVWFIAGAPRDAGAEMAYRISYNARR